MLRLLPGVLLLAIATPVHAEGACANPRQMDGFKTCADVTQAEQEGKLVVYSTDPESASEGEWTWGALVVAGIAYNPRLVTAAEAPRDWPDVMDPKWADAISVKVTISGLQHTTWFVPRELYGNDFRQKLMPSKPHAFDSHAQYVREWNSLTGMR